MNHSTNFPIDKHITKRVWAVDGRFEVLWLGALRGPVHAEHYEPRLEGGIDLPEGRENLSPKINASNLRPWMVLVKRWIFHLKTGARDMGPRTPSGFPSLGRIYVCLNMITLKVEEMTSELLMATRHPAKHHLTCMKALQRMGTFTKYQLMSESRISGCHQEVRDLKLQVDSLEGQRTLS